MSMITYCTGPTFGNVWNAPLEPFLDGIKTGKWAKEIRKLRAMPRNKGASDSPEEIAFSKLKNKLPCVMLSCTTNGGRKASDVVQHSGLLQLDIDGVGADEAVRLRDVIGHDRHILAAWLSPSLTGAKGIMRIPADIARHKESFQAAAAHMLKSYGVEIDKACSNVNRLCFVSHDPDMVSNPDAVPLEAEPAPVEQGNDKQLPKEGREERFN